MRRSLGLYRRPSGIYAVRISVPTRLRFIVGKAEIHVSTGYHDSNSAIIVAHKIQLYWREHLMALDEKLLTAANPLLQTPGSINLIYAASLIGLSVNDLLLEFRNQRRPIFVTVDGLEGYEVTDIYELEREGEGFVINDVEIKGVLKKFSGQLELYDTKRSITSLIEHMKTTESIFRLSQFGGFFPEELLDFNIETIHVNKKDVELVRSKLAKFVLPITPSTPVLHPTPPHIVPLSTPHVTIPATYVHPLAKHGHKRFSELFEQYKNDREWKLSRLQRMNTEAGMFIELMNDPRLDSIESETIQGFANALAKLPPNTYQAKRRFKLETLSELMDKAAKDGLELKHPLMIKGHVSKVSEILNYGVRSNMLQFNPAKEFKRGGSKRGLKKSQDDREIFSESELHLIFSQYWFANGKGVFDSKGGTHWRPFYYWLPLLALLSGGRLNELSQLYLDDIKLFEDEETYYFDFNLKGEGKVEAEDKSLKTFNSVRVVPIHHSLIELGFINYVKALREAGEIRLFPELKHDKRKGYGKAAGSWFNERFLGNTLNIERDGMKTFHSFRHTFMTALEKGNHQERTMAQIAGHEKGSTETVNRYAKDRSPKDLSPIINGLSFAVIEQVKPFDIKAGLKAVIVAKKVKTRNQIYKNRPS